MKRRGALAGVLPFKKPDAGKPIDLKFALFRKVSLHEGQNHTSHLNAVISNVDSVSDVNVFCKPRANLRCGALGVCCAVRCLSVVLSVSVYVSIYLSVCVCVRARVRLCVSKCLFTCRCCIRPEAGHT